MGLVELWSLRLDFEAKMASSQDGMCPYDLLRGQVAGTCPLVCANLKGEGHSKRHIILSSPIKSLY